MRNGFRQALGAWLIGTGLTLAQAQEFHPAQGFNYPGAPQVYSPTAPMMQAPPAPPAVYPQYQYQQGYPQQAYYQQPANYSMGYRPYPYYPPQAYSYGMTNAMPQMAWQQQP